MVIDLARIEHHHASADVLEHVLHFEIIEALVLRQDLFE